MKPIPKQAIYLLNDSDLHRIDAAVCLLKQILEDVIERRKIRVPTEPYSPSSLYELEQDAAQLREERKLFDNDF
jgi:hypothetical protein